MIFTADLEELIFNRHQFLSAANALTVLSGYVGPGPIRRLASLPFHSKVIYGMYGSEGIRPSLHSALLKVQADAKNVSIFYSKMPIHAKCYTWYSKNKVVGALIGSANFSSNGLRSPHREVLSETTQDSFTALNDYVRMVLNNSIACAEAESTPVADGQTQTVCLLSLVARGGEVQNYAGLNWGQGTEHHTHPSDAYIKITTQNIRDFPLLFPPKQQTPAVLDGRGKPHRHNDPIEILWDDGVVMEGLLMGNQNVGGVLYPKQITSFPKAKEMGLYLRRRLGVPAKQPVRRHHLDRYGRTDISVSPAGEGVYKFDFSAP